MQRQSIQPTTSIRAMLKEEGGVLMDIEQGLCFSLSPVAAVIWAQLQDKASADQILDALQQKFPDIDKSILTMDLQAFLAELAERNVVQAM